RSPYTTLFRSGPTQRWDRRRWLPPLGKGREQSRGRRSDLGDGLLERFPGGVGEFVDPADLTDVLPRGRFDLLGGRGRLEPAQLRDVPAHASRVDAARVPNHTVPNRTSARPLSIRYSNCCSG